MSQPLGDRPRGGSASGKAGFEANGFGGIEPRDEARHHPSRDRDCRWHWPSIL
ncbi:MAG: hypothetical protein ABWZ75_11285 [Novosphingobium sp.]